MKRLLALGVAAGLAAVLALPGAAFATGSPSPSTSASQTTSPSPSVTPTPSTTATSGPTPSPTPAKTQGTTKKPAKKPAKHSGTTVAGPRMCKCTTNPNTGAVDGSDFRYLSTVTVSQTNGLVNQMVTVSWTGFTPSANPPYNADTTDYPVMVAQCSGTDPTPNQCFGATHNGVDETSGPDGPDNAAYAVTDPNGTGQAEILLYTTVQNQALGCDATHACSLVVWPSQGGDSLDYGGDKAQDYGCKDHEDDAADLDTAQYAFSSITSSPGSANGYCSWQKRIIIPLHFAATPNGCPQRAYDFTSGGSPMVARAMLEWESALCFGSSPVTLQYNSSVNESEARQDLATGLDDVAFTTQPLTGHTTRPYTYAPVAVSAVSLAYWVDNMGTGQPYVSMKMDPRLVAKLLTTSYDFTEEGCPLSSSSTTYQFGCDSGVDKNPENLFADPEFIKLNPNITNPADPTGFQIPTVVAGNSDMTWVTTGWIAANKDASNFLAGQFDPWGMHVDTYYLGEQYPTDQFVAADPYFPLAQQYSPTFPLSQVATYQALNWMPGDTDTRDSSNNGNYDALSPETVGDRDLFALTDQADAAADLFPTVALENAAGKYVEPTDAAMAAAVNDMAVNPDGITRSMDFAKNDPAAYPLTMIVYAVVPTGGISAAKAAKIAQFLDFVANQGQVPGTAAGDLPQGFLPLPNFLRQETLTAADKVLNQTGDLRPADQHSASPTPSASSSSPSSKTPSASPSPSAAPSASRTQTAHSIAISFSRPDVTGMSWVVLALLIAGMALIVAGPAALIYGSPAARATIVTGARRVRRLRMKRWQPRSIWRRQS